MAGRSGRRARPLATALAAGLAAVLAGSALAGRLPEVPAPPAAPAALPPGSVETPGRNELVSTPQTAGGALQTEAGAGALTQIFAAPTISADGRFVVFLRRGALRGGNELVLRDRRAKRTTVLDEGGVAEPLDQPTISANGRWIAYVRQRDAGPVVSVVDRTIGKPVPLDPPGRFRDADQPALSADGRYVVLRALGLEGTEILLYDITANAWEVISVDVTGAAVSTSTGADPAQPAISGDGRYVAFTAQSALAQFVNEPKGNDFRQVFLRDRTAGATAMLSRATNGQAADSSSLNPAISANGGVVAFPSAASDLVGDDENKQIDVFAWSAAGGVEIASRASDGTAANGPSGYPAVTADGGSVAFASGATTLVPGDTTAGAGVPAGTVGAVRSLIIAGDVFVRERGSARTTRVSLARDAASEANGISTYPSISSTGRFVAFTSIATNLVATDANEATPDVFVRDRPPRVAAGPNPVDFGSVLIGSLGTTRPATVRSTGITAARIGDLTIGGTHATDFFVAANDCSGRTLAPRTSCQVQIVFIGTARGNRRATLEIASDAGTPIVIRLVGAVGVARLKVEPAQGPPGIVVVATGSGFPPNAPVTLGWSAGITATPLAPVVSDATGSFVAQVLVLPRDRLGKRNLRALASVPGLELNPVAAGFLVVPSTAAPPTSGLVQVFAGSPGEPIILRR